MSAADPLVPPELGRWFACRGWQVRGHQRAMLEAARAGRHALLLAEPGAGKTLAGFLPTLAAFCPSRLAAEPVPDGLHTLYVAPLKALAADVRRNVLAPVEEIGLPVRIETRTGDTSADHKRRQRLRPPHLLLTTPESLSLLLSHPESFSLFAGLRRVVVDEIHAFAPNKRGDLLALCLARLQRLAPAMQRAGLSATVAQPQALRAWLAPRGRVDRVALVRGEPGAPPHIRLLLPEGEAVPWAGHAATWAIPQVHAQIRQNRTTLIFANTRFLAEHIFAQLWQINEENLPIGLHHGSLSSEERARVETAMATGGLRALVCTSSLDLGVDWGDVDLVVQMGAPRGASRLLQRIGRANHRLDQSSRALVVPGNRFEYLEAIATIDAIAAGELDGEDLRPGGLDVLAQHAMACACAGPFDEQLLLEEVRSCQPYAWLDLATWRLVLDFVATGGYSLRAYERYRRIRCDLPEAGKGAIWRLAHPGLAQRHRLNAGIIVEAETIEVRFGNGRSLGRIEERFAASLRPGDTFQLNGQSLEVEALRDLQLVVRASSRPAMIPSYGGLRLPLTSHVAGRVQRLLADRAGWERFPAEVRAWLGMQDQRSGLPGPGTLLVESFPHARRHYSVYYTFAGWNANQSLGMLVTSRMERRGLLPGGFVATDYALAVWGLGPVADPAPLLSPDILADEFSDWVHNSHLLRRAFREVAVVSGLVERQVPGKRKSGRQVTVSTDLIYDVLRKHEPGHLLIQAAWADARQRLTDVERLAQILQTAAGRLVHVPLDRVSPLAVPVLMRIGQEHTPPGALEDNLLLEAAALAEAAMEGSPPCR